MQRAQINDGVLHSPLAASRRSGGERRISNFLLWQAAYAELVFVDKLWPDFGREDLLAALAEFARRDRRFGGVSPSDNAARAVLTDAAPFVLGAKAANAG